MDYRQTYTLPDAVFGDEWLPEIRLFTTNETLTQTSLERLVIEWSRVVCGRVASSFNMDSEGVDPAIQITDPLAGSARVLPDKFIFPKVGQWVGNCAFYFAGNDLPVSQLILYISVQDRQRLSVLPATPNAGTPGAVTTQPIDIQLTIETGTAGDDGWSPILAIATDGDRRVLRVSDWAGGTGTKPASGGYIGVAGIVANIQDAVDIRGATGATGPAGVSTFAALTDKTTVDLPATNTPTATAIGARELGSNKKTDIETYKTSNTFFPSIKAVFDWVSGLFVKGAVSSTDNALVRFDGATGKTVQNSMATIDDSGSATFYSTGDVVLRIVGSGNSTGTWKGRIIAGGDNAVFLMGESSSQAWLGAHNGSLTAWADIHLNPAGGSSLYLGHIGGNTVIKGSAVLNGQIIDNVGSSGEDGQVLKKVGGLVRWSNP